MLFSAKGRSKDIVLGGKGNSKSRERGKLTWVEPPKKDAAPRFSWKVDLRPVDRLRLDRCANVGWQPLLDKMRTAARNDVAVELSVIGQISCTSDLPSVAAHQVAIAGNVGGENGCEPAGDAIFRHSDFRAVLARPVRERLAF